MWRKRISLLFPRSNPVVVGGSVCFQRVFPVLWSRTKKTFRRLFGENFHRRCQMESCSKHYSLSVYAKSVLDNFLQTGAKKLSGVEQQVNPPARLFTTCHAKSLWLLRFHGACMFNAIYSLEKVFKVFFQSNHHAANKSCRVELKFHACLQYMDRDGLKRQIQLNMTEYV